MDASRILWFLVAMSASLAAPAGGGGEYQVKTRMLNECAEVCDSQDGLDTCYERCQTISGFPVAVPVVEVCQGSECQVIVGNCLFLNRLLERPGAMRQTSDGKRTTYKCAKAGQSQ